MSRNNHPSVIFCFNFSRFSDCVDSTTANLILLLDSSSIQATKLSVKSALSLIDILDIENTDLHLGVSSYADDTQNEVPLQPHLANDIKTSITKVKVRQSDSSNVTNALQSGYLRLQNSGRNTKKVLILFSDGHFNDSAEIKTEISRITDDEVVVMVISIGEDANFRNIRDVVSDPFFAVLIPDPNDNSPYSSVKSEIFQTFCDPAIFKLRQ